MGQFSRPGAGDFRVILTALEEQLLKLDELGAGIAAIHVDAAIEQLRSNLAKMEQSDCDCRDETLQTIMAFG